MLFKIKVYGSTSQNKWEVVFSKDVPEATMLGGSFVLAVKDEFTSDETWKVRFFFQGHRGYIR